MGKRAFWHKRQNATFWNQALADTVLALKYASILYLQVFWHKN